MEESDEKRDEPAAKAGYDPKKMKRKKRGGMSFKWPVTALFLTFFTSSVISFLAEITTANSPVWVSILIVLVIIAVSILFDAIGTAAASCSVEPFLSMAARKVRGARRAVSLVKNAEKVSSVCADIIGDICGIVSGAAGAAIALLLFAESGWLGFFGGIAVSSVIAALTVGGKAFCKKLAIAYSQTIIFAVAKVLSIFSKN